MNTHPRDGGAGAPGPLDMEQAEAAIVEHYRRLVRLAYVVLPPSLGRHRRVLTAHAVAQRALPRAKSVADEAAAVPRQRAANGPAGDPGYALVRLRALREALDTGRPPRLAGRELGRLRRAQPLLPRVFGLRLRPRSGGGESLALEKALAGVSSSTRAAFALQRLEGMSREEARTLLVAAGMSEPHAHGAVTSAARLPGAEEAEQAGPASVPPQLEDPAVLHLHPTDLVRRRQRLRTAVAVAAAVVVGAGLLAVVPDGGPSGNPAALQALDPSLVVKARAETWQSASRLDFAAWPARGALTDDNDLLRRALAVWADPDDSVRVSATPGTAAGPAAGPPQLLYAGEVGDARLVIMHDGLRLVRYGEPLEGEGAVLDFARTDGADGSTSAVVLNRDAETTRYLTAPWVAAAEVHDLLLPGAEPRELALDEEGVTGPVANVFNRESCTTYPVVRFAGGEGAGGEGAGGAPAPAVLADMGELLPAQLGGDAGSPLEGPGADVWARTACHLSSVNGEGVRTVTSVSFASQELPGGGGTAQWVCTRAETWRGAGSRAMTQFQGPQADGEAVAPGVVTARAEDTAACGERAPELVGGILWKSDDEQWFLLAAGTEGVASISAEGGVSGSVPGRIAALPATEGAEAELSGTLSDGTTVAALS
ncbi:hypothetical protein [Streptomyces spiramenti]|uniref:DNA-directed RNA polymerase specialized sigma24 family protein n=1 Tax=Streptomyces spiramenti TaxID=2720606 RepID=A0ABX1AM76_9ACTN|nr:hypothetical protein [Streptomyces spiramenti]